MKSEIVLIQKLCKIQIDYVKGSIKKREKNEISLSVSYFLSHTFGNIRNVDKKEKHTTVVDTRIKLFI